MVIIILLYCYFVWEIQIVCAQQLITTTTVDEGGSFTVICDGSRAGVPENVATITKLSVYGIDGIYARYRRYIPPYSAWWPPYYTPSQNWTFKFYGSLSEIDRPNNRYKMKIQMEVHDARCIDYFSWCQAVYLNEYDDEISTDYYKQTIKISVKDLHYQSLTLNPQYNVGYKENESLNPVGSNVTLTCEVKGPKEIEFVWLFGNSSADVNSFLKYPVDSDITISEPTLQEGFPLTICYMFYHKSELTFKIKETTDGLKFVCLVEVQNTKHVKDITIHTKQSIVNPIMIEDGKQFSVICDTRLAGVQTDSANVVSIKIEWTNGTEDPITYAEYKPFQQPSNFYLTPETRNWSFVVIDGIKDALDRNIQWNSTVIKMMVYDAKCSDAGFYLCTATYNNYNNEVASTSLNQSVISLPRAVPVSLTLDPQYEEGLGPYESVNPEGSNITLTCNATGPINLSLKWKFRKSSKSVDSSVSYLEQNGQPAGDPVQVRFGTTCVHYLHSSKFTFQADRKYDGYTYVCVATANNEDTIVGNMTIYVTQNTTTAGTSVESDDIVSPSVIVEGGTFTVTCDASRAGVPTNVSKISKLFIAWSNGTTPKTTYARYRTYIPPYNDSFPPQTSPPRNWTFTFSGNQQGTTERPNNTNSMKIKIIVYDAKTADEGVYFCIAHYFDEKDFETIVYSSQRIKNETTIEALNSANSAPGDYSFLYYVIPVAAGIVLCVIILAVCFVKVRRDRARKRRFNLRTLPAIHRESLSPPMDSNGYLSPVDPNGGYAQISDVSTYESSANYYSSINELEFIKESDEQSENTSGMQDKQEGDLDNLSGLDTKRDGQLDTKRDGQVDTNIHININADTPLDTKTDKDLDKDRQNDSTPADDLNVYTKLYDTPEDVYSPDGDKYLTPNFNFESVI